MQTVRSRAKNSRYAHSNGAFPRDERILFNDIKTYLKCKLQGQLQMAVLLGILQFDFDFCHVFCHLRCLRRRLFCHFVYERIFNIDVV